MPRASGTFPLYPFIRRSVQKRRDVSPVSIKSVSETRAELPACARRAYHAQHKMNINAAFALHLLTHRFTTEGIRESWLAPGVHVHPSL